MKFLAENWFFILVLIGFFYMMSGHGGCGMHGGHGGHGHGDHEHKADTKTETQNGEEKKVQSHHH